MADRPILFSAPMVRALLDGRKTQTRRIFKGAEQNENGLWHVFSSGGGIIGVAEGDVGREAVDYLPIQVGDRLWVRETWQGLTFGDFRPTKHEPCEVRYFATDPCADLDAEARGYSWRPSIFMPRFASRLTLTVTEARVERLQDITWQDAEAEGVWHSSQEYREKVCIWRDAPAALQRLRVEEYGKLWDRINGHGAWDANPWVAAYTFTVERKNIDEVPA